MRCVSYNCNSIRNNSEIVKALMENNDLVFLQEIMLNRSALPILHDFNENFSHVACSKEVQ